MIKALWYILIGRVDPEAVVKLAEGTHHLKRKSVRMIKCMACMDGSVFNGNHCANCERKPNKGLKPLPTRENENGGGE